MKAGSCQHTTFVIERGYAASPARVFAAWADPALKARWFNGPSAWQDEGYVLDFRVGGREHLRTGAPGGKVHRYDCCYQDIVPDAQLVEESGLSVEAVQGWRLRAGRGCGHCRGTGFRGRRAISEIMLLNDEIRELIVAREPIRRVKEAARSNGTKFLRDAALEVVKVGHTTFQEINRVTLVG